MNKNFTYEDVIVRCGYFMDKRNVSAYDLSLKLGHSQNYIYKIQSGRIKLTVNTLLEILEILEVSTSEFFS